MNEQTEEGLRQQIDNLRSSYLANMLDVALQDSPALYHYTNLESAHAIISTQKLRFTNALYLNDPTEIKNGLEIADRVIERLTSRYTANPAHWLKRELLAVYIFL